MLNMCLANTVVNVNASACHGGGLEQSSQIDEAFQLGTALGSGTVATVRRVTRKSDGKVMAVKCVSNPDEEIRQFTRDEYEVVRSLNHPAIVRFEEIHETISKVYICMEFCQDGSVQSRVDEHGIFNEGVVRSLGLQMLRGVNHLHEKRVVHRDIKPDNLLLQKGCSILKITDFNSAKRIGKGDGTSLMLTDRGTPLYSAPELRFGLLWNERVDIWSCGLSLYFMHQGSLPFDSQQPPVKEVLAAGHLPIVEWNGLAFSMQRLIKLCLTVNMQDRPLAMELLLHPVFRMGSDALFGCSANTEADNEKDILRAKACAAKTECSVEPFAVLPGCGLVALAAGSSKRFSLSSNPEAVSPGSQESPDSAGGMSCYLFGPMPGTPDTDESPVRMCRSRDAIGKGSTYASFKAPRRFDALLQLATHKF